MLSPISIANLLGGIQAWLPLDLLAEAPCPLCRRRSAVSEPESGICERCSRRLDLSPLGIQGDMPMPWWAAGRYEGGLRSALLNLRRRPCPTVMGVLVRGLLQGMPERHSSALLVPIASWKRHANPLPPMLSSAIARATGLGQAPLLARSRPVLGQHHLNRRLRIANQEGAFRCVRHPVGGEARRRPLLLVDDILTTGATVSSAARALKAEGWQVRGVLCLARTPVSWRGSGGPAG